MNLRSGLRSAAADPSERCGARLGQRYRFVRRRRAVLGLLATVLSLSLRAQGEEGGAARFDFDLASQPLDAALSRFGDITRQPALFPSELTASRMSSPVRGRWTAREALQQLLAGTGLAAQRISSAHGDTFLLQAQEVPEAAEPRDATLDGYPAFVQASVLEALCGDPVLVPGHYQARFQLRLNAAGRVEAVRLLTPTGSPVRDARLLAALRALRLEVPPPPTLLHRNFLMSLQARTDSMATSCAPHGSGP